MKIYREIVKKIMKIFLLFFQNKKYQKKKLKKYNIQKNSADVSAPEFFKNTVGLSSSTVYRHYQSLKEKRTSNRKMASASKNILSPN